MDERNCGFCKPCAAGKYDECEMRKEENLHSAAQEMLEALEEVVNNYVEISNQEGRITRWCLNEVKKAIAKAKGEA